MSVNRLIFGTASVGSRSSYSEFSKTASRACSLGINVFDTAPMYGRGLSQKYLARFIKTNPSLNIKVITKVGRLIKVDFKTLMIYFVRLDFSPIFSGMVTLNSSAFCLSNKCISRAKYQLDKWFNSSNVLTVLVHSPDKGSITPELLAQLDTIFESNISIGCSDPSQVDYHQLQDCYKDDFIVQVGYEEFLKRVDYQSHAGHLVINGIFRFSQNNGISLIDLFDNIDKIRKGRKTSFNFGFYSCEVLTHIVKSYNDYASSIR